MSDQDIENLKATLQELNNRTQHLYSAVDEMKNGDDLDSSEQVLLAEKFLALDDCVSRARIPLTLASLTLSHFNGAPFKASLNGQTLADEIVKGRRSWDEALA